MEPRGQPDSRRARVERVFFEQGWDNIEDIDEWDGDDVEALREMLTDEQFQTLLDELADAGARDR